MGKVDVAVAPSDGKRVYALMQTADQGSVWRSDDAGATWKVWNWQRPLIGRAGYYTRIEVSPSNPDEILVASSTFFQSTDGGKTFNDRPWGGDNHDIWWDPLNADHFGITYDAGARITSTHGAQGTTVTLPNGQMYHVAVDKQVPPDGATRFVAALKPSYGDKADRLVVNLEPEVPHRFTPLMLTNSIQWFSQHLKP